MNENTINCGKHYNGECDGYKLGKCAGNPGGAACIMFLFDKLNNTGDSGKAIKERDDEIAMQKVEIESLQARLRHLFKSGYISMFDMIDPHTGDYARDIRDADTYIEQLKKAADKAAEPERMYFICDRRACESCSYPQCTHTTDCRHAENFALDAEGYFVEKTFLPDVLESDGE